MSEERELQTPHECGGDAAAYVLGALTPEEAQAFRVHLESCVVCRDEVAAFERVVDVLPAAVPQYRAPKTLRRRVLRAAREQPPPTAVETRQGWARAWPVALGRPWLAGAGALAAAAIVVAIVLAVGGSSPRVITASVTGPGSAQVRLSGGQAELILRGFRAPPAGDVYEVWLQRGSGQPQPTSTLFSVTSQGRADIGVTAKLTGVTRLMVTAERAGGSLVPTHAPVLVAQLVRS